VRGQHATPAPAAATPKRASALGAVKKTKAAAPTAAAGQQSHQHTPDQIVASSSGDAAAPVLHADSSELPVTSANPRATAGDHKHRGQDAAPADAEPVVSSQSVEPDAAAEHHDPQSDAAPVHPAASAAAAERPTVAIPPPAPRAAVPDAADADGGVAAVISLDDKVSDQLKRRELQLEVLARLTITFFQSSITCAASHLSIKALAAQLGASEEWRVRAPARAPLLLSRCRDA
jgi:hypothetical protein